ncbi:unnamed protein product [Cyprideis torosa]|uniref:Uncharacterized protein n=1 Tax=Cyprideis torosa TaxID=163714 RepID=A0A7R8ZLT8_9CRUS|nr:unnamed protein product [Cyprideis torosa]CAG0882886.1 unnamed protein product [Cyprideis torosa]
MVGTGNRQETQGVDREKCYSRSGVESDLIAESRRANSKWIGTYVYALLRRIYGLYNPTAERNCSGHRVSPCPPDFSGDDGNEGSDSDSGESDSGPAEPPCDIMVLERLIRTHPIWYLPGIQRSGAVHLLQGKEDGTFIVRQSSKSQTLAISVRLPPGKGPPVEHYLVEEKEGSLCLETSNNKFPDIPSLVAHYCQCWYV